MFFNKKTLKKTDHVYKFGSEGYFSHWKPVTDFGVALGPQAGYFRWLLQEPWAGRRSLLWEAVWLDGGVRTEPCQLDHSEVHGCRFRNQSRAVVGIVREAALEQAAGSVCLHGFPLLAVHARLFSRNNSQ